MDSLHQSRNLTVNQTLDEILGLSFKSEVSQSTTTSSSNGNGNGMEKNSLNSPMRPPTRHGRGSSAGSSNEENKDPIHVENGNVTAGPSTLHSLLFPNSSESTGSSNNSRRHSDDEFFKKLNDIRRRSLISTMDAPSPSIVTNSISFHSESPTRESRPRLAIHVEESEPPTPLENSKNSKSLEISEESPSLTFRIETDKNDKSDKEVVPKLELNPKMEKEKKLPPKRPKSVGKPAQKKVEETTMMRRSMFNTSNSKPSDAHHKEWLAKKEKEARERKKKEKEEEEKKTQAEKERRENSAKLYQRWVQDHDEKMKKFREIKNSKIKEKREATKTEKEQKQREAEKNFEIWKQERSKSATDLRRKTEEEEEKKKRKEEEEAEEKHKEAQAAFLAWKKNKEQYWSEESRKARKEEKIKKAEEEEQSKEFRFMCANEAYETWMEMKEKEREMLADLVLIEAPPIPWIPPSNMIPRQFIKTSSGNRPKTRSQSAKSNAKRSRSRPATTTSLRPFR